MNVGTPRAQSTSLGNSCLRRMKCGCQLSSAAENRAEHWLISPSRPAASCTYNDHFISIDHVPVDSEEHTVPYRSYCIPGGLERRDAHCCCQLFGSGHGFNRL